MERLTQAPREFLFIVGAIRERDEAKKTCQKSFIVLILCLILFGIVMGIGFSNGLPGDIEGFITHAVPPFLAIVISFYVFSYMRENLRRWEDYDEMLPIEYRDFTPRYLA